MSFPCCKLHFGSHTAQRPMRSDSASFQAALSSIHLMTLTCGTLCQFAVIAGQQWWNVHFRSIDNCSLGWLCCWARCEMLQDTDNMDGSFVFYVKVGMLYHLAHSQIGLLTVNEMGIVRLTAQHEFIVSISFMDYPGDCFRQTSADIRSLAGCAGYISKLYDFGCRTPQCILGNKRTMSDQHIVSRGTVGHPCNMHPYAAGFNLSVTYNLALTSGIVRWR
jgi:hypothetical protein